MANIMKMMKQMADMQKNLGKVQEALAAQSGCPLYCHRP